MQSQFLPLVITSLVTTFTSELKAAGLSFVPHQSESERRTWAFETGVSFLTPDNIGAIFSGNLNIDDGPAGGEIYSFTAARRLGEFKLDLWRHTFRPQLEIPLMLEIIDENSRSPFWDINASLAIRWEQFPWNHLVKTTLTSGVGLSYSSQIYLMDIKRHPMQDRSKFKINWPLQLTLAMPQHPDHQLMLYIAHQSGGNLFDEGGTNGLGVGYRFSY